ncbi:hypothetical protein ABK046_51875, partial [Streptomyces caeruleatus]
KRSLGDNSDEWTFDFFNPESQKWESSEPLEYHAAVAACRHYLINSARGMLGRELFTKEQTGCMSSKCWQHFV